MKTNTPNSKSTQQNSLSKDKANLILRTPLEDEQNAGHADHWHILTDNIVKDVPNWLQQMIDGDPTFPKGLNPQKINQTAQHLLLSDVPTCHIKQIVTMTQGRPTEFINAFPCVHSPYGITANIENIIYHEKSQDAILKLKTKDNTVIYAFDQLYTVNQDLYQANQTYYINLGAWAYSITPSKQDEIILIEDPDAIRYHRAFNDIVAKNNGEVPPDIQTQIQNWQPDSNAPLAPVEINLGHMCAYLFGDTHGQQDEAWCQGQVLNKLTTEFYGKTISLFDLVILREPNADPLVVRVATPTSQETESIGIHDYVQANLWLQAAIYQENQ